MRWFVAVVFLFMFGAPAFSWDGSAPAGGSSHFSSDGTADTPLQGADSDYFYCSSEKDAQNSLNGQADWQPDSISGYCHFRYKDNDDSWQSGWERSRLTNGCIAGLNALQNKVYKCWDYRQDPAIASQYARFNKESAAEYAIWKNTYLAKTTAAVTSPHPLVDSLRADVDDVKSKVAIQQANIDALEADARAVAAALTQIGTDYEVFLAALQVRQGGFDGLNAKLNIAMALDSTDFATIASWTRTDLATVINDSATLADIAAASSRYDSRSASDTVKVCQQTRSSVALYNLRLHQALTNELIDDFLAQLDQFPLRHRFTSVNTKIQATSDSVTGVRTRMNVVFSPQAEALNSIPPICKEYAHLPVIYSMRRELATTQDAAVALGKLVADFSTKLVASESEWEALQSLVAEERSLSGIAGRFNLLLTKGHVSEAIIALADVKSKITFVEASNSSGSPARRAEASAYHRKATASLATMQADADGRLTLAGAPALVALRFTNLTTRMGMYEDSLDPDSALAKVWLRTTKPKIYHILGAPSDQDLVVPGLSTMNQVLAFDERLEKAERQMDTLEGVSK